jgi:hypothetical protein
MQVNGQLHPRYSLDRCLGEPQTRSRRCGGNRTRPVPPVARRNTNSVRLHGVVISGIQAYGGPPNAYPAQSFLFFSWTIIFMALACLILNNKTNCKMVSPSNHFVVLLTYHRVAPRRDGKGHFPPIFVGFHERRQGLLHL